MQTQTFLQCSCGTVLWSCYSLARSSKSFYLDMKPEVRMSKIIINVIILQSTKVFASIQQVQEDKVEPAIEWVLTGKKFSWSSHCFCVSQTCRSTSQTNPPQLKFMSLFDRTFSFERHSKTTVNIVLRWSASASCHQYKSAFSLWCFVFLQQFWLQRQ